ncbi:DNA-directed RNA polymerase III subunit RPC5 [Dendroctonus ponderosae]
MAEGGLKNVPIVESSSEDEDDPVVKEIPIFHSKKLEDKLYLFQFPLFQPSDADEINVQKCKLRPENKEVELQIGIGIDCSNFDSARADLIAHEIDGDLSAKKPNKKVYFENETADTVYMKSSRSVKEGENYAIAAYNGSEIHLTALSEIFQMRSFYPYLDKGLKKKKEVLNNDSDDEKPGPSHAEPVTVRFKHVDDPTKKGSSNLSYKDLQARRNEEAWLPCTWHDQDSTASNVERLKLIADTTDDLGQAQNLTKDEYIKVLVPEDQEETPREPMMLPSHVLSLHALRGLPLQEQCRLLLKDAHVIQFHQIMLLLAGGEGVTADALLKNLQKVGVLVRGNWVVKSEVLYPENTFSATSGVPAELMCRARDYILYLFTKHQYVERTKVSSLLRLPTEEVKEILAGMAQLQTHNKGWELSLPTDQNFLSRHADVAQRQNLFWEHRYHQLSQFLIQPSRQRRKSKSASESEGASGKARNLSCSDNEAGADGKGKPTGASRKKMAYSTVNAPK